MAGKLGQTYTSGDWRVKAGSEEEFVSRWNEFIRWTLEEAPGAGEFHLMQDDNDPQHFISMGSWSEAGHVAAWRASESFGTYLGRCKELCDAFRAGDYTVAAALG